MEYRRLGSAGLKVSALSFGSWVTFGSQLDVGKAAACMRAARDAGVNFFDTAEVYNAGTAEEIMGRVIKDAGWKRSDLVISTKIYWGGRGPNDTGLSRKHLFEGTHAALKRLQLDYVDLLFCHRPDLHTPIEETVAAMTDLVRQGKAFYWGTSEWSAAQIVTAAAIARREHLIPPQMEQPEYNMFRRDRVEKEYLPLYGSLGLGTTIWSPLASGVLSGKYQDGIPKNSRATLKGYEWLRGNFDGPEAKEKIAKTAALAPIATELGMTLAQLAIAWCLKNPHVSTVITGASEVEQVKENMQALPFAAKLGPEVLARIEAVLKNKPEAEDDWRD
ncbi:MAG: aldo/keto reductase [Deltaproteobacteria bacterium]|nr:aldo/keto reductase [Deltaproteobacteria bacterium]